jgi:hypothetical protein
MSIGGTKGDPDPRLNQIASVARLRCGSSAAGEGQAFRALARPVKRQYLHGVALMSEKLEGNGGHLRVAEGARLLAEGKVCGNDRRALTHDD